MILITCVSWPRKVRRRVTRKAQVDDQDESDIEVEDNYNLDHLNRKDKFIIMKIVEKNDELEEENEKQEQSLQKQELFLISKIEELKALSEWYEKLSIEHALVTNSSSRFHS